MDTKASSGNTLEFRESFTVPQAILLVLRIPILFLLEETRKNVFRQNASRHVI
jgi:hypothetical protein